MKRIKLDRDDLRYCNCAQCGVELLGESMGNRVLAMALGLEQEQMVKGRILGRPFCGSCLVVRKPPPSAATPEEDGGPWQQNAIRDMEEGV